MKSISVKLAVASILSLAAANAMALGLNPQVVTVSTRLNVSGATATNNALGNVMKLSAGGPCVAGTLTVLSGSGASAGNVGYLCTSSANISGVTAGQTILLVKESLGGSANGVHNPGNSLTPGFPLTFLGASISGCAAPAAGNLTASVGDFAEFNTVTCNIASASVVPDVGISDVDPGVFEGIGGVTGADLVKYQVGTGSSTSVAAVTFNPIVSTALFAALQSAQSLGSTLTLANMPSMTSAQLRGIFKGTTLLGTQLQLPVSGDGIVHLCRRGNTSGTMTSFKLHFLGEGCTKNPSSVSEFNIPENSDQGAGSPWVDLNNGGDLVFAGSGSGDVRSCVNFHSQNGNYAVGLASTESRPASSGTTNQFRYIKVDGAEPTLKAVMEGRYDFFTESTVNIPDNTPAVKSALFSGIRDLIAQPAVLAKVNEAWQNSGSLASGTVLNSGDGTGDVGILAIPTASANPTFPIVGTGIDSVRTKPINSQRRVKAADAAPNNCNRPYQAYPSL
jgi:hypothetical protein